MKQLCKQMAGAVGILFILAACGNDNSNYPQEYVGFDKATKNYSFDREKDMEEFDVKIIAAEKKNEDREVLTGMQNMDFTTMEKACRDKELCSASRIRKLSSLQKRNQPIYA